MLEEAADLGFKEVELSHGIPFSLWPGILAGVAQKIVGVSSLHNFCPVPVGLPASPNALEFSDPDPRRRERAQNYTRATIEQAAKLGAKAVVLHLGSLPSLRKFDHRLTGYMRKGQWGSRHFVRQKIAGWQESQRLFSDVWPRVRDSLLTLGEFAQQHQVKLGLENRENLSEFPDDYFWDQMMAELPDIFGHWHDFGHGARKDATGWIDHLDLLRTRSRRLFGCHLHDFSPPQRDHLPLGFGGIPFQKLWTVLPEAPLFVLELSPRVTAENIQTSLQWWNQHKPALAGASSSNS
jgi:sugar phosphate isomerase/epimerase